MHSRKATIALALLASLLGSSTCSYLTSAAAAGVPEPGASALVAHYHCTGATRGARIECRELGGVASTGARLAVPGQNQVKLRSSNVRYDTATLVFSFDVQVQNLLAEPIGTADGDSASGMKVYYERGPTATSYVAPYDTGTIRVRNAEGRQNFTAADQPYHLYPQILQPRDSTPPKRWEWTVPRSVHSFSFAVRVFTSRPSEARVPATIPRASRIPLKYYEARNQGACDIGGAARCVFDVVEIRFHDRITQEERQAAVDLVGGVYDGAAWAISRYYIRLPADSTFGRVRQAVAQLRSLPQVEWAGPYSIDYLHPERLRPLDGAGWETWQPEDSLADGRSWGLEAISAPPGWGV